MKINEERVNELMNDSSNIQIYLENVNEYYRPYDPGSYLYKLLLSKNSRIFERENIELIYVTLSAWNMNQRGAKLSDINTFCKSILENRENLSKLQKYRLEKVNDEEFKSLMITCKYLFDSLDLVAKKKNPPKLVTYSKTLHFIAPNLIVPIDRTYTIRFFRGNTGYNNRKSFEYFNEFHKNFRLIAKEINLKKYVNHSWNLTIPKIIDNTIIGYVREHRLARK